MRAAAVRVEVGLEAAARAAVVRVAVGLMSFVSTGR